MKIRVIHENNYGFTSRKNAERYLAQRRAVWANSGKTAIKFVVTDPRHQKACAQPVSDGGRAGFDQIQDVFGGDAETISRLLSPAEGDWRWICAVHAQDRRDSRPVTLSGIVSQYGKR